MTFVMRTGRAKAPGSKGLMLESKSVFSTAMSAGKKRETRLITTTVSVITNTRQEILSVFVFFIWLVMVFS